MPARPVDGTGWGSGFEAIEASRAEHSHHRLPSKQALLVKQMHQRSEKKTEFV